MQSILHRFFAVERFSNFSSQLGRESRRELPREARTFTLFLALILGALPGLSYLLLPIGTLDTPTFVLAFCMLGGLLLRAAVRRQDSRPITHSPFWRSISFVHTGVAISCIPLVLLFALFPNEFGAVKQSLVATEPSGYKKPTVLEITLFVSLVAFWAGTTEEVLYRGVILSLIRRWRVFKSARLATYTGVILSSALFASAHLPLWGPVLSLALFFIGIGFGIGYVASGERLESAIAYHIVFDLLSLSVALIFM